MSGPDRIYLEPECCADPSTGRMWCEDPDPVPCEDGAAWTDYVRLTPELAALIEAIKRWQVALDVPLDSPYRTPKNWREIGASYDGLMPAVINYARSTR